MRLPSLRWLAAGIPLILTLLGSLGTAPVHAQEHHAADEGDGHHYKNELALFLGNTNRDGRDAFTVGLDYARAISERLAIGVFFDRATGDRGRAWVLGVPLYIETGLGHLSLTVGAGIEEESTFQEEELHGATTEDGAHESGTLFMVRLGAQYPLHFGQNGRFFVAPQANVDITEAHAATVLGAIVGVTF